MCFVNLCQPPPKVVTIQEAKKCQSKQIRLLAKHGGFQLVMGDVGVSLKMDPSWTIPISPVDEFGLLPGIENLHPGHKSKELFVSGSKRYTPFPAETSKQLPGGVKGSLPLPLFRDLKKPFRIEW